MKSILCLIAAAALLCGCHSVVKYPPSAGWGPDTKVLGRIEADSGRWSLSLRGTPPQYHFETALRKKAAKTFLVPESSLLFGELTVEIGSELDGTIRDWKASALAGQKPVDTVEVAGRGVPQSIYDGIVEDARAQWPRDYQMQETTIKSQVEAYKRLHEK